MAPPTRSSLEKVFLVRSSVKEKAGAFNRFERCLAAGFVAALLALGTSTLASPAQTQDYESWADPSADPTKQMVEELRELIDQAERDRAANARFLANLRAVLSQYDQPRSQLLIGDNFADGNFNANPKWTVAEGKFYIDYSNGLRSQVKPKGSGTSDSGSSQQLAAALLELLNPGGQQADPSSQQAADRAVIYIRQPISNAFDVQVKFVSFRAPGRVVFMVFQKGQQRTTGYALNYLPGQAEAIQLLRITSSGSAVVETSTGRLKLEDNRVHHLDWMRSPRGDMSVAIDGRELFRVNDRGFKDPFAGFAIVNAGGYYSIREVAVHGTR